MRDKKFVCVYCGSSTVEDVYQESAKELGTKMATENFNLVYGGGKYGLMGIVADAVMAGNGYVTGYIPDHLEDHEGGHTGLDELYIVDNMHTRKMKMFEKADAFVILPGGFGTLDELFEILTWRQLGLHSKPIIIANINGYWDALKKLAENVIKQNFARPEHAELIIFKNSIDEVIKTLQKTLE